MPATQHLNWGAEALWLELVPLLPGLSVEVVARMGSTNTELLERARVHSATARRQGDNAPATDAAARRQGDSQPCLLVAEQQTQGRGRQGKAWQSSPGASLTFSLSLPYTPVDWSGLSLAVGLALADALDPLAPGQAPRLGLKWPNDLLLIDGSAGLGTKLGGILIETVQVAQHRLAVVGIGLNIQPLPDAQQAAGLSWGYGCVQQLWPDATAPAVLARVAPALIRALRRFEHEGFGMLQADFDRRDVLRGQAVTTTLAGLPQGVADGVDATGTLWLRVGEQRHPVGSGEVSLRPAPEGLSC